MMGPKHLVLLNWISTARASAAIINGALARAPRIVQAGNWRNAHVRIVSDRQRPGPKRNISADDIREADLWQLCVGLKLVGLQKNAAPFTEICADMCTHSILSFRWRKKNAHVNQVPVPVSAAYDCHNAKTHSRFTFLAYYAQHAVMCACVRCCSFTDGAAQDAKGYAMCVRMCVRVFTQHVMSSLDAVWYVSCRATCSEKVSSKTRFSPAGHLSLFRCGIWVMLCHFSSNNCHPPTRTHFHGTRLRHVTDQSFDTGTCTGTRA